jgi:hypothetical protein
LELFQQCGIVLVFFAFQFIILFSIAIPDNMKTLQVFIWNSRIILLLVFLKDTVLINMCTIPKKNNYYQNYFPPAYAIWADFGCSVWALLFSCTHDFSFQLFGFAFL